MTRIQLLWRKLLQLITIGGVFFVSVHSAIAQRIPIADNTLGNERSIVSPDEVINDLPSSRIDGGARRGANLFHSFGEFNIDRGRGVYFSNPDGVGNILTRITGGSQSEILGTLGVLGNANLFLINPNGIFFGRNARLDIGGSFLTSTANSIVFDSGFAFSATDPQAPPLLAVNVPIGLQYGSNPAAIQVRGASLQVSDGQTLTLAGGTVNINGGELLAFGGRVELAGIASPGEIGLTQQGQEWRSSVPEGLGRADVEIANDANVDVSAGGGGSIAITARNLTGTGLGTQVRSGIAEGLGTEGDRSGDIAIDATEAINLDRMVISNEVAPDGAANAGDIKINTGSLSLTNGAQVSANKFGPGDAGNININTGSLSFTNGGLAIAVTSGQGDAGNIAITATDAVSFDGVGNDAFPSGAFSFVGPGAIGRGGNIDINTDSLSLTNGAVVSADTFGQGDAGSITITADAVSFDGTTIKGNSSGAYSAVAPGAIGRGGNISINTGSLSLTSGGLLSVSTFSRGEAGNITITADAVSFDGTTSNGLFSSGAFSSVEFGAIGRGGNVSINTGSLSLSLTGR